MQTYQIFLLVLLGIIAAVALVLYASYRAVLKRGTQFVTVGTVEYFQKGKIPFLGSAVVSYTKSGRPYQARTNIIPTWRQPKKGSRGMYTIITCHTAKGLLVQARRQKSQKH